MILLLVMAGSAVAMGASPPEPVIVETFDTQQSLAALVMPPAQTPPVYDSPFATGSDADDPGGPVYSPLIPMGDGGEILAYPDGFGVVRNGVATSSPAYHGPPLGPDPAGARGGMLHVQRASMDNSSLVTGVGNVRVIYRGLHEPVSAGEGEAVFLTMDIYKGSHAQMSGLDVFQSPAQGWHERVRCFIGGDWEGTILFNQLASLSGDPGVNEGLITTERFFADPSSPDMCVSAKAIPEHGWITLGVLFTSDGRHSVWVRDRETILEAVTPMRTSGPYAGQRMFAELGFGLEQGWAQHYPGTDDDPVTLGAIEGYGPALRAVTPGPSPVAREHDANGNMTSHAETYWSSGAYGWFLLAGNDQTDDPAYAIEDWWVDNYTVHRTTIEQPCPADLNRDSVVAVADLALVIAGWDTQDPSSWSRGDLAAALAAWGACP